MNPKRPAPSRTRQSATPPHVVAAPKGTPQTHSHARLAAPAMRLADHYAWIAAQTLRTAVLRDEDFRRRLLEAGRDTARYDALRDSDAPATVREWLDRQCAHLGPVHYAIREQLAESMRHAVAGAKDKGDVALVSERLVKRRPSPKGSSGNGPGPESQTPGVWPCCAPYCQPP